MLTVVLLLLVALSVLLGLRRRQAQPIPAALEYWVYLPEEEAPTQDAILTQLFEQGAIGPQEGLLFSDIRLHFAVMRREKNAHLFLLDLLEEATPLDGSHLEELAAAKAIFKIRYVCDPPAKDDRYVRLLPQVARVSARLAGSNMIYDLYQRRVFTLDELDKAVKAGPGSADVHARVMWIPSLEPRAETRGLRKKQLPELVTDMMEPDEENLVTYVLNEAARQLWTAGKVLEQVEVEYFGSLFLVQVPPHPANATQVKVRLLRKEVQ